MRTKDYRTKIAQSFLQVLQEQELDWKKGWIDKDMPRNAVNGRSYQGINRFHLKLTALVNGYTDSRWATFNQIKNKGWRLDHAKGKGVTVEYWYPYDSIEKEMVTWETYYKAEDREKYQIRAKYTTVFNGDLIVGIPELERSNKTEIVQDDLIEKLSRNMDVKILYDGKGQAYYLASDDSIHLPEADQFLDSYEYNSTVLHELTHATGAEHRLNRGLNAKFGTPAYAYEELVAEIGSCFLGENLRIEQTEEHIKNHKAYVQSWIKLIEEKPEELVKAIQSAEKAASYMEYKAGIIPVEEYEKVNHASAKVREELSVGEEKQNQKEAAYYVDAKQYVYLKDSEYCIYDAQMQELHSGKFESGGLLDQASAGDFHRIFERPPLTIDKIPMDEYWKLRQIIGSEPQVNILFTQSDILNEEKTYQLSEVERIFTDVDYSTYDRYQKKDYFDQTEYRIDYVKNGRLHSYTGSQKIGGLEGTLTERIYHQADFFRNNPDFQGVLSEKSAEMKAYANHKYDQVMNELVPYLQAHIQLSVIDQMIEEKLKSTEILSGDEQAYFQMAKSYIEQFRTELNTSAKQPMKLPIVFEKKMMEIERDLSQLKDLSQELRKITGFRESVEKVNADLVKEITEPLKNTMKQAEKIVVPKL